MNRLGIIAVALGAIFAVIVPLFLKPYGIYLSSTWAVLTIAAMGLNLTLGYAGQVSLAQGAFVGIGAYTTALLMHAGVPYPIAFIAAGLLCFSVGWVLGYPALRVQHHYLAFVTLAFTTLVFLVLRNEEWLTGGTYGLSGIPRPVLFGWSTNSSLRFYYFSLGVLAVLAHGDEAARQPVEHHVDQRVPLQRVLQDDARFPVEPVDQGVDQQERVARAGSRAAERAF